MNHRHEDAAARRLHPDSLAYATLLDEVRRGTPRHKRPIYAQRPHALARYLCD